MPSEFGRRFRLLEKQIAEIREYLHLPAPLADGDAPPRSTVFIIADTSQADEPTPRADYSLGSVLHLTTDPRLAHELLRSESARAPGTIGMFCYSFIEDVDLRTYGDAGDLVAQVLLYFSPEAMHVPIRAKTPEPESP